MLPLMQALPYHGGLQAAGGGIALGEGLAFLRPLSKPKLQHGLGFGTVPENGDAFASDLVGEPIDMRHIAQRCV
jgi:hypothetical protein